MSPRPRREPMTPDQRDAAQRRIRTVTVSVLSAAVAATGVTTLTAAFTHPASSTSAAAQTAAAGTSDTSGGSGTTKAQSRSSDDGGGEEGDDGGFFSFIPGVGSGGGSGPGFRSGLGTPAAPHVAGRQGLLGRVVTMTTVTAVPPAAVSPTREWRALGTTVQLAVSEPEHLDEAVGVATAVIDHLDRTCSRFRPDSDLSRANAAAGSWVQVDGLLVAALGAALHAARVTGGLVDPTLGRVLAAQGYDRDLDDVRAARVSPTSVRLPSAAPRPGAWREVGLDRAGAVLVPEGTALDLGATGKAFGADLVAAAVVAELGCGVAASLGGDVAVAGPPPVFPDGVGWPVTIEAVAGRGGAPLTVLVDSGGLATSSTRRRTWRHRGRLVHHLLDPSSGRPVPPVWSEVSVRATSCLDANAATTAAMVMGERAVEWLDAAGLPALLRRLDGRLVGVAGWAVEG